VGIQGYFVTGAGIFIFIIAPKPAELAIQPAVESNWVFFFPKEKRRGVKLITQLSLVVPKLKIE
jgi:hypothetical protein